MSRTTQRSNVRTIAQPAPAAEDDRKHSHYFKATPAQYVDVYRVCSMFEVIDPCLQHAVKKLLVAGQRGGKDIDQDVQEAIDSLTRWQEMREEDLRAGAAQ